MYAAVARVDRTASAERMLRMALKVISRRKDPVEESSTSRWGVTGIGTVANDNACDL
jgi:hypothetical protein